MPKTHIEYSDEKELDVALEAVIDKNPDFIPFVDGEIRVAACFVVRMDEHEQTVAPKGEPLKLVKVPPEMQIFMTGKIKPKFILVVDRHWWENSNQETREGGLGRYLYRIEIQRTDDGLKLKKVQFDIQESSKALKRYGRFDERSNNLVDLLNSVAAPHARRRAPEPEPEPPVDPDAEEPARVVARPIPKKAAKEAKETDDDPAPARPARKIPADPKPKVAEEPPEIDD